MPPGQQAGPGAASCSSSWKGSQIFSWRTEKNPGQDQASGKQEAPEKVPFAPVSTPASRATQAVPPQLLWGTAPGSPQLLFPVARKKPRACLGLWLCFYLRNASLDRNLRKSPLPKYKAVFQGYAAALCYLPCLSWPIYRLEGPPRRRERLPADRMLCAAGSGLAARASLLFHQQSGEQWAGRNCEDGPSPPWGGLCTAMPSGEG